MGNRTRRRVGSHLSCLAALVAVAACGTTVPDAARVSALQGTPAASLPPGAGGLRGADGSLPTTDQQVPTASPQGAAGGASSGAGAPTAALPSGPGGAPGATARPQRIVIGVVTQASDAAAAGALGFNAADNGDEAAIARALVAHVNSTGGLGGIQLVPAYYNIDQAHQADSFAVTEQSACDFFTQDNHAFAVVMADHAFPDHLLETCLSKRGVVSINTNGAMTAASRTSAGIPGFVTPNGIALERHAQAYVDVLAGQGYFSSSAKVGLLASDYPELRTVVETVLQPAVKRLTGRDLRVEYMPGLTQLSDVSAVAAQSSSTVLRFQSEGIDHVMFFGAGLTLYFMPTAESQGYHPVYGLSTTDVPNLLVPNGVPAAQLHGAMGVGWIPDYDATTTRTSDRPPGEAACVAVLKKAGQSPTSASALYVAAAFCEGFSFLQQVMATVPGSPTPAGFISAAQRLPSSFRSALTFVSQVAPRRPDGVRAVRGTRFDDGCSCFHYVGTTRAVG